MNYLRKYPDVLFILLVVVLCVPLLFSLLPEGLYRTIDGEAHLHRMIGAGVNWNNDYFWSRWLGYAHAGYGYPVYNYYAPLFYMLGGVAWLYSGISALIIFKLMVGVCVFVHGVGAYTLCRLFARPLPSVIATVVYLYAPMRFYELWLQMNAPQFMALAITLWVMIGLASYIRTGYRGFLPLISLGYALIVLTHQITAFLVTPFLGVWVLVWLGLNPTAFKRLFGVLPAGVLGIIISAVYWLPTLAEIQYIQISTIQDVIFTASSNLIPLSDILSGTSLIDPQWQNWGTTFSAYSPRIGQIQALMLCLGIVLAGLARTQDKLLRVLSAIGGLIGLMCVVLSTELTQPLWEAIGFLRFIQFPWRLLNIALIFTLPCVALIITILPNRWRWWGASVACVVVVWNILALFYPPLERLNLDNLQAYDALDYETRTGNLGLTPSNDYLPIWATNRPQDEPPAELWVYLDNKQWFIPPMFETIPPGATVEHMPDENAHIQYYRVDTPQSFTLSLRQMYFPAWEVRLDGKPVSVYPSADYGLISVDIPAGQHGLALEWVGTSIQHLAEALSVLGVVLWIGLCVTLVRLPHFSSVPTHAEKLKPIALFVLGWVVLSTVIGSGVLRPVLSMPSLPQIELSQRFGDSIELFGYDWNLQDNLLEVTLYWRALQPITQPYSVSLQVGDAQHSTAYISRDKQNIGNINTLDWQVGQYQKDRYRLILPENPPSMITLFVGIYEQGNPRAHLQTDGQNFYRLLEIVRP
jgi:hypothetical protein